MSVMTKFLKQTCLFEKASTSLDKNKSTVVGVAKVGIARVGKSSNLTDLSMYGDILYEEPVRLKCRREKYVRDMLTTNGAIIKANSRYFLDESTEIQTDDRLDGHVVLACEEYIDSLGKCVGYEAYV